jgi:hypothetical protein
MDTLVSLGVLAACGWSVYPMFVLDRGGQGGSLWERLIHDSGGGISASAVRGRIPLPRSLPHSRDRGLAR